MAKKKPSKLGDTWRTNEEKLVPVEQEQCDFGEELFTSPTPDAPNPSRLGVMNNAFADITSAIAELGDLDDLVKYGAETQRPEVEAARFGNVAALMSGGSEELTLLAQRIRQLTNSIHSNLF